jgi:putative oxidoreductase
MALFTRLGSYSSTALLIMRIGLGAMMIVHGFPKLTGGDELWIKLGGSMKNLGVNSYPMYWGLAAALTETLGGLLLLLGFLFRPVCLLLLFTMVVAAVSHFSKGQGIKEASHAIELAFVFLSLFILGPGKYSVDKA